MTVLRPPLMVPLPAAELNLDVTDLDAAISAAVSDLVAGAPGALDTLNEIAAAVGDDANYAASVTTALAAKLAKAANLSDLANAGTARTNLGLGTAATHAHSDYATAAQGTKADAAVPAPGSHTDGRVLAWSTSLGAYTEAAPSGAVLLASSKNVTGTVTTASAAGGVGTAVAVPGTSISVGNSGGLAVMLKWDGTSIQTVAGDGIWMLGLRETTAGAGNAILRAAYKKLPNTATVPTAYGTLGEHGFDIGVVTTTRTFDLVYQLWSPAANSPTATLVNATNNPTTLRAIAGV